MTQHKDQTRLRHMLAHAWEAVEMARMRSRQDLDTDRQLNLSLVRIRAGWTDPLMLYAPMALNPLLKRRPRYHNGDLTVTSSTLRPSDPNPREWMA